MKFTNNIAEDIANIRKRLEEIAEGTPVTSEEDVHTKSYGSEPTKTGRFGTLHRAKRQATRALDPEEPLDGATIWQFADGTFDYSLDVDLWTQQNLFKSGAKKIDKVKLDSE